MTSIYVLRLQEPISVSSHVVTISSLLPATAYNCSVTSFSHDSPSVPTFIAVSTMGNAVHLWNLLSLEVLSFSIFLLFSFQIYVLYPLIEPCSS